LRGGSVRDISEAVQRSASISQSAGLVRAVRECNVPTRNRLRTQAGARRASLYPCALTPVPPPRSTHTRSPRSASRAAHAASIGLRAHRNLLLKLSSARRARLHMTAILKQTHSRRSRTCGSLRPIKMFQACGMVIAGRAAEPYVPQHDQVVLDAAEVLERPLAAQHLVCNRGTITACTHRERSSSKRQTQRQHRFCASCPRGALYPNVSTMPNVVRRAGIPARNTSRWYQQMVENMQQASECRSGPAGTTIAHRWSPIS
jgi:hypothetical protein